MKDIIKKSKDYEDDWVPIIDKSLTRLILRAFGDDDKEKILRVLAKKPDMISSVLEICKIPKTSGYRKINSLIDDGLLLPVGLGRGVDGKKITQYVSAFENLQIEIVKNKVVVKVQIHKAVEDLPDSKIKDLANVTVN
ncbi:MAG TPA: hypothetical protein VLB45_05500 [Nitrosopumilaceae archaeon]|nr:hypothetical protein [Nitrosopumilaceae archaeon]